MTDEKKRKFVDKYNAAETLHDSDLISDSVYNYINLVILRTIIAQFAMELNKEDKNSD